MSGLLINNLSDHKMIFTLHKNKTYIEKVNKFVEIEKRDDASMSNFAEELLSLNIYDKLDTNIANDPNQNYEKFAEAINYAREKHLPKKKVKYNSIQINSIQFNSLFQTKVHTHVHNNIIQNKIQSLLTIKY